MAKRPSVVQIRARQVKLATYQFTTKKSDTQIAKEFGLTTKQVRRVKNSTPRQLQKVWNRAPSLRKVYTDVGPVSGKGSRRVGETKLIKPARTQKERQRVLSLKIKPEVRSQRLRAGVVTEAYYPEQYVPIPKRRGLPDSHVDYTFSEYHQQRVAWAEYTSEWTNGEINGLPNSMNDIRELYYAGYIDDDEYDEIVEFWKETYGIK